MAVCFQASQLTILDYNRVVKDLNGLTSDQFLDALTKNFEVIDIDTINVNVSGDEEGIPCYEKMAIDDAISQFGLDILKPAALHSFLLYLDGNGTVCLPSREPMMMLIQSACLMWIFHLA